MNCFVRKKRNQAYANVINNNEPENRKSVNELRMRKYSEGTTKDIQEGNTERGRTAMD